MLSRLLKIFKKISFIFLIILCFFVFISCKDDDKQLTRLQDKIDELIIETDSLKESNQKITTDLKTKEEANKSLLSEIEEQYSEINKLKKDIEDAKIIINNITSDKEASLSQISYLERLIIEYENEIELLNTKYNNLNNYFTLDDFALKEAHKVIISNEFLQTINKEIHDGIVIKVIINSKTSHFVIYKDNLYPFDVNNENNDFKVKDELSENYVKIKDNSFQCDKYFVLPKLNGVDKICEYDESIVYFYYHTGLTLKDEKDGLLGDYLFKNDTCIIYNGMTSLKSIEPEIKNIIFMIPDGAGFGSYDYTNLVKKTNNSGINQAKTRTTTHTISGLVSNGLYLDNYMIASSNTLLYDGNITDSGAGGTALSSGYKTNYCYVGVDHELNPRANILEVSQLSGKATGVVTTKSWIDATPSTFLSHSSHRSNQEDLSYQSLNSNVDVLLAYGTDTGCKLTDGTYLHNLNAQMKGYTIVNNYNDLYNQVYLNKATKVWSNFTEGSDNATRGADVSGYHISYDVYAEENELSLLDMSKAALEVLSNNINDEDGFFLMIEGGAIDNAAHGRLPLETTGEYLAFDETFAYFVKYASKRNDTIVIAAPDHDTGAFIDPLDKKDSLINTIISNNNLDGYTGNTLVGMTNDHSEQNVPVWFYGPSNVRTKYLNLLGIPEDTCAEKVRSGMFYDKTVINKDYEIMNYDIVNSVITLCDLMTFNVATNKLFVNAMSYGTYDKTNQIFTFNNHETIKRNENFYTKDNKQYPLEYGRGIYIVDPLDESKNTFYIPLSFLIDNDYY